MALLHDVSQQVGPDSLITHVTSIPSIPHERRPTCFRQKIERLFITRTNVGQATHRLLDGGNLSVNATQTTFFVEQYMDALSRGEHMYVVELKTDPVFRMFFDLDIHVSVHDTPRDTHEWLAGVCKHVMITVQELFDETLTVDDSTMLVCMAPVKSVQKNAVECVKYGLHLHFPHLHVTTAMAVRIRQAVVQKLCNNQKKTGPTTWAQDIDDVVYGANGLRMLYSRKMSKCKCTSTTRQTCATCLGTGRVDEGRAYVPVWCMDMNFVVKPIDGGDVPDPDMLSMSSVRSSRNTCSHAFNSMPPCWFEDTQLVGEGWAIPASRSNGKRKQRTMSVDLTEGQNAVEHGLSNREPLHSSDLRTLDSWFTTCVRKRILPKEYKNIAITKAFSFSTSGTRSHIIARIDSQYCMNIGREHSTNTVYLEVNMTTNKAYMRCYCRCETTEGRITLNAKGETVMCKDYRSTPFNATDLCVNMTSWQHDSVHSATGPLHPDVLAII